jgi:hypothetical protein
VYIEQDPIEAIKRIKQSKQPTILLLDIDDATTTVEEDDDDDEKTLLEFSCSYSSSCSSITTTTRHITLLISKLTRDLNSLPNHVPLVG